MHFLSQISGKVPNRFFKVCHHHKQCIFLYFQKEQEFADHYMKFRNNVTNDH